VPLPVGEPDPCTRLQLISAETRQRKQHADDGFAAMLTMPASLARIGVAWARRAASGHVGLYVSNVPGPPFPLYLAGARLLEAVPLAPLVAGVALSVTALSYDGVLAVALLADGEVSDLGALAAGVQRSLDQHAIG
jgi:diacylglycerol O-acyltransferase / wax synthase